VGSGRWLGVRGGGEGEEREGGRSNLDLASGSPPSLGPSA
jgi:hypothetical protein